MQKTAPKTAEHYTTTRTDGIQKQQIICSGKKPTVKQREINKMIVKELIELLKQYPEDLEVIQTMFSDYVKFKEDSFGTVNAVDKGGYIMRSHPSMSDANKLIAKEYLHIKGN